MSDQDKQIRLDLLQGESVVASGACTIYAAYIASGAVTDLNRDEYRQQAVNEAADIAVKTDRLISEGDERFDDKQDMGNGISIIR